MKVESKTTDFHKKLAENVTTDKFIWAISPKKFDGKEFSGIYDKRNFSIHLNSHFSFLRLIEIKGIYKRIGNRTEISYEIVQFWNTKKVFIILFCFLILINLFPIFNIFDFPENGKINLILIPFLIFLFVLHIIFTNIGKRIAKKKFEGIFEII